MKRYLILTLFVCGFAMAASAQSATGNTPTPSAVAGSSTEIKKTAADADQPQQGGAVAKTASTETPSASTGSTGSAEQAKTGKTCCKAGASSTGACQKKCTAEEKKNCAKGAGSGCCKKKTTTGS